MHWMVIYDRQPGSCFEHSSSGPFCAKSLLPFSPSQSTTRQEFLLLSFLETKYLKNGGKRLRGEITRPQSPSSGMGVAASAVSGTLAMLLCWFIIPG